MNINRHAWLNIASNIMKEKQIFQHAITMMWRNFKFSWMKIIKSKWISLWFMPGFLITLHCISCSLLLLHNFYHHIKRYLYFEFMFISVKKWILDVQFGTYWFIMDLRNYFTSIWSVFYGFNNKLLHKNEERINKFKN